MPVIETPLGRLLLKGEVHDGQTVLADVAPDGDGLAFTAAIPQTAAAG